MLAEYIRRHCADLQDKVVLELDPSSPLRSMLGNAKKYIRTYYSQKDPPGLVRRDGARCEDITKLSFGDRSIDIIISSDVLEHISDLEKAFEETARVLKPGGFHLFTVPVSSTTQRRAEIRGDAIVHHSDPILHFDPMNPDGIIVFWDFGIDAASIFSTDDLVISIVEGPRGKDRRFLFKASKKA